MKLAMFALFLCMSLVGCATYQKYPQSVPSVSRTVALMPFSSVVKGTIGQQAANWVAEKLMEKGYIVIDSSFTTTTVSEAIFYESGLTDEVRRNLLAKNLTTLVFGSVNAFSCDPVRYSNFLGTPADKNRCTVSLTAKMVDTATGRLLWELILADSAEVKGLTAFDLMKPLISANISATLPLPAAEGKEPANKTDASK
jgi:hypothetical protein